MEKFMLNVGIKGLKQSAKVSVTFEINLLCSTQAIQSVRNWRGLCFLRKHGIQSFEGARTFFCLLLWNLQKTKGREKWAPR